MKAREGRHHTGDCRHCLYSFLITSYPFTQTVRFCPNLKRLIRRSLLLLLAGLLISGNHDRVRVAHRHLNIYVYRVRPRDGFHHENLAPGLAAHTFDDPKRVHDVVGVQVLERELQLVAWDVAAVRARSNHL